MADTTKVVTAHCNSCLQETRHELLTRKEQRASDPEDVVSWRTTYELLECRGCEAVHLKQTTWFSEDPEEQVEYYPPRVARPSPDWLWELGNESRTLLEEVYAALHADSRRLAMMGARTLVDMYMVEKVGDVGTFPQKLRALEQAGLVSRRHREILKAALDAGNAAVHRGHVPKVRAVNQVIDIVENLLKTDLLEESAEDLRSVTPSRQKAPKKAAPKSQA